MENIYVIGHKNPDTDSMVSAVALAHLLNIINHTNAYKPAAAGEPNEEVKYVFNRFGMEIPQVPTQVSKVFLVDHNELSQSLEGISADDILGIVDHHKLNFSSPNPIDVTLRPWGSTSTIISWLYKIHNVEIPQDIKNLILCAVISDTIMLKGPTTTPMDISIVSELGEYEELGLEMLKAKAKIMDKSAEEIVNSDVKEYEMNGKKVFLAQIELPDLSEIEQRKDEILSVMKEKPFHTIILMLTDVVKCGSKLLVISQDEVKISQLFGLQITDHITEFIPGMLSRKKQVVPVLNGI